MRGLGGDSWNFSARPLHVPAMWCGYIINMGPPNFSYYFFFSSSKLLSLIGSSLPHQSFSFLFSLIFIPLPNPMLILDISAGKSYKNSR